MKRHIPKRLLAIIVGIGLCFLSALTAQAAEELSLYDSGGRPTAYVAKGLTIYLWSGTPVAYLTEDHSGCGFHVYGFNGKHLGWFVDGVIRDHCGGAVGALKEVLTVLPQLEPLKGLKELMPLKGLPELAPLRPLISLNWSEIPLKLFLLQGTNN